MAKDADDREAGYVRFITLSSPSFFRLSDQGDIILNQSLPEKPTSIYNIVFQARDQVQDQSKQRFDYFLDFEIIFKNRLILDLRWEWLKYT